MQQQKEEKKNLQLLLLLLFAEIADDIIRLLVHYTKIVNLYDNQSFNYCHQTFTIKLILYKIMFKSYYIIYYIIKVVITFWLC